jgi:putative NIF3 family GTP cyclohydrolase 1 type 2
MNSISRREFVSAAVLGPLLRPGQTSLSAGDIVERIKQKVGVEWKRDTVDTFKAGDPATIVRGIAVCTMPTIDVLKQAASSGSNLVITCEPTFYSKADAASPPAGRGNTANAADPIFNAKNDFIKRNGLVIWRFSDHWRQRKPDPLAVGLTEALGWSRRQPVDDPARVTLSSLRLDNLAADIKKKLGTRGGIRVVGDPRLSVQKIGLLPGTTAIQAALTMLPAVDVVIAGEVREWETVEYARDKVTAGEKKGLILLGRIVSENPGMKACAEWVKTVVPELRTTWIPIADPYWRPS